MHFTSKVLYLKDEKNQSSDVKRWGKEPKQLETYPVADRLIRHCCGYRAKEDQQKVKTVLAALKDNETYLFSFSKYKSIGP